MESLSKCLIRLQQIDDKDSVQSALVGRGYRSIFDISARSSTAFADSIADVVPGHAEAIYAAAAQMTSSVTRIYRALQARGEPRLQSIPKMGVNAQSATLLQGMVRSLGGDTSYPDLFPERAPAYADAASIQSLFSPGKYLTELYAIARGLHAPNSAQPPAPGNSPLNIDSRRPDIGLLALSEQNMNEEIATLDLLLEVLDAGIAANGATLADLETTYFPMSLPYSDNRIRIESALAERNTSLDQVWSVLNDEMSAAFSNGDPPPAVALQPVDPAQSAPTPQGSQFQLKAIDAATPDFLYSADHVSNPSHTQGWHLNIGKGGGGPAIASFQFALDSAGATYMQLMSAEGPAANQYLRNDNDQDSGASGSYALLMSDPNGNFNSSIHEPLYYDRLPDGPFIHLYNARTGLYLGEGTSGSDPNNLPHPVFVDCAQSDALTFAVYDTTSGDAIDIGDLWTRPDPATREQLDLPPATYALLTGAPATASTIQDHYKLASANIETELRSADVFGGKLGLDFNDFLSLTAQNDYKTATASDISRFADTMSANPTTLVKVSVYGQTYVSNSGSSTVAPLLIEYDTSSPPGTVTNLTSANAVAIADRAERLARLARQTALPFYQLDWIVWNVNGTARTGLPADGPSLNEPVLDAVAQYVRLNRKYGLQADPFACLIGSINTYAELGERSFHQQVFSRPDTDNTALAIGATLNFDPTDSKRTGQQNADIAVVCGALGVDADTLYQMAQLAFMSGATTTLNAVVMNAARYAQLYRLALIPRLCGLSVSDVFALWNLLDMPNALAKKVAGAATLDTLRILERTEIVTQWMASNALDVQSLTGMLSASYSETASADIFNYLDNIYHSLSEYNGKTTATAPDLRGKLCKYIAGQFHLKANVMDKLVTWLDLYFVSTASTGYGIDDFWTDTCAVFSTTGANLDVLQSRTDLVRYCHAQGQYALIAQWGGLTELDLALLVDTPAFLLNDAPAQPPFPSLRLLLTLSRLKEWQLRVAIAPGEAMRYFSAANASPPPAQADILALLATANGWDESAAVQASNDLFGDGKYPVNFEQVFSLATWMRIGKQLNVGVSTLEDLLNMSQQNPEAEGPALIQRTADSVFSGALTAA
ncbi:Tc toxin subunit A [Paraburkholderia fungorum]|uniref:Tc toxin subunit A n=1 Tax=Paraburkholderia fungorum TaxID=134537 RepID=UPI0038BB6EF0